MAAKRKAVGSENAETMDIAADLLLANISQGKFAEAEPLERDAVQFERKEQSDSWQRFRAESELGAVLSGQTKYMDAEPLLAEGYRGLSARVDRIPAEERSDVRYAREWLVQLYRAWGKPVRAAEILGLPRGVPGPPQ